MRARPLNAKAHDALTRLKKGKLPRKEFLAATSATLLAHGLVTVTLEQSPYVAHRGKLCEWLTITDAGRAADA